jgi:threonylcarbamoyladenosine tRNA methylthiotransferase MtaB
MTKQKVSFVTLGCRVNQYETRKWMDSILNYDVEFVPFGEKTQITVINSCVVTKNAERDTRKMVYRAKKFNPDGIIILTGCYVDIYPEKAVDLEKNLIIIQRDDKKKISNIIKELLNIQTVNNENKLPQFTPLGSRPPLLIQTGCDKKCAYCIIPHARGNSVSREKEEILFEYKNLFSTGVSEIVLTGINLGSWGKDFNPREKFSDLLKLFLENTPENKRLRIGSIEPEYITDQVIESLSHPNISPHIHIPLQGSSNRTLKRMGRPNTISQYTELLNKIKNINKKISIGADLICGFPEETLDEHLTGIEFVKTLPLSYLHVFPFSPRPGTRAFDMEQIPKDEVKKRAASMRKIGDEFTKIFYNSFIGKRVKVVNETSVTPYISKGMAGPFFQVLFSHDGDVNSDILNNVEITKVENSVGKLKVIGKLIK